MQLFGKPRTNLLKTVLVELFVLLIITTPAFVSLLNGSYFSMHDDQHIVRLFLLDTALKQGDWYPRWVDGLGFGFGYPLFNFYPPFIYYLGELFHLIGFSLIWSMKFVVISGFYLSAVAMYYFAKRVLGRMPAFVSAALYVFFLYHGITAYVRGALAEFFSFAILPFLFLSIWNLYKEPVLKQAALYGVALAVLILVHPLIAFPALFFIAAFTLFGLMFSRKRKDYLISAAFGFLSALGLSAFFWLPSIVEKQYTLVDAVLTRELADYAIHFVCLKQLWFSAWGYGGSIAGCEDGISFQLGKVHIGMAVTSVLLFVFFVFTKKDRAGEKKYLLFLSLAAFSLFMVLPVSRPLWDTIRFLAYLQFPWRFLTFAGFFVSVLGGFAIFFFEKLSFPSFFLPKRFLVLGVVLVVIVLTIIRYAPLFRPQSYPRATDQERTSAEEVKWRISRSSFEYIPDEVATRKSELGTTIPVIDKDEAFHAPAEIWIPEATVEVKKETFREKIFRISAPKTASVRVNTFHFPGWTAYIDGKKTAIESDNPYRLISVQVPSGSHELTLIFEDTPVRRYANAISIGFFLLLLAGGGLKLIQVKR